jgi:hypothetical protein
MNYADRVLREIITRPISALVALIELPGTVQRSLRQANELMESSRRQLEAMQAQTEHALKQAERMNEMLGRVVKLAEPLEKAQRGGEYVGGRLKRAIFGEEAESTAPPAARSPGADETTRRAVDHLERAVEDAEAAAGHAEEALVEAEDTAEHSEDEARSAAERVEEARKLARNPVPETAGEDDGGWQPAASRKRPGEGVEVPDSATIRVIPNQPRPGESEPEK